MNRYAKYSILTAMTLYVVILGLLAVFAVLGATSWDEVKEVAVKGGLIALILVVLNLVVAFLMNALTKRS